MLAHVSALRRSTAACSTSAPPVQRPSWDADVLSQNESARNVWAPLPVNLRRPLPHGCVVEARQFRLICRVFRNRFVRMRLLPLAYHDRFNRTSPSSQSCVCERLSKPRAPERRQRLGGGSFARSPIRNYALVHTELKSCHILLESSRCCMVFATPRLCQPFGSVKSLTATPGVVEMSCGPVAQASCRGPSLRSG